MAVCITRGLRLRAHAAPAAPADVVASPRVSHASRRRVLGGAALLALSPAQPALAAKAPAGFTVASDATKGFSFVYPVGWQARDAVEVTLEGQDRAFKDVIQPLESVSLSISPTARASLAEAGTPEEVARSLISKSAGPGTKTAFVAASERKDANGTPFYVFEFTSSARNVTRHSLTTLAVTNGKVFTLTTGCGQPRWAKMEPLLRTVVDSFALNGY